MKSSPQVAVIVVSYNTRALLRDCLRSIVDSTGPVPVEVIVVDNASDDGSADEVQDYPNVTLIKNDVNVGFGVACNQGIRATSAPLLLLLNSDARLTPEAFVALGDVFNLNERCGAAGCRTVNFEGVESLNTWNFLTPFNQALQLLGIFSGSHSRALKRSYSPHPIQGQFDCNVDWIDGACLMIRRAALEDVGVFDERFFIYSEDEDLCLRLKRKGWVVCYCGNATAIHQGAASSSQNAQEMLSHFYLSQLLFLQKHRGSLAVGVYAVAMHLVLALKRLGAAFLSRPSLNSEELKRRQQALRMAWSLRNENRPP